MAHVAVEDVRGAARRTEELGGQQGVGGGRLYGKETRDLRSGGGGCRTHLPLGGVLILDSSCSARNAEIPQKNIKQIPGGDHSSVGGGQVIKNATLEMSLGMARCIKQRHF